MKRYEIRNGALAPVEAAGGTAVPRVWQDCARRADKTKQQPIEPLRMRVANGDDARRNGDYLLGRIRESARALLKGRLDDRDHVRDLSRLVAHVPTLAISVPEVIEYLGRLLAEGYRQTVVTVLGGVRRGRPMKRYDYLVALVDQIKRQESVRSDAAACKLLRDLRGGPFDDITVERMKIIYSEQRALIQAARSYHVDEKELAEVPPDLLSDLNGTITR